jgi:hypothetical protein
MLDVETARRLALATLSPAALATASGGWGRQGRTNVQLDAAEHDDFQAALRSAWRSVAPKRLLEGAE